jgi:hypothetical protein
MAPMSVGEAQDAWARTSNAEMFNEDVLPGWFQAYIGLEERTH